MHLLFNPLPGLIHQDSHQAKMDKGVLPFTMRESMTMCIAFEESIGHQGLTEALHPAPTLAARSGWYSVQQLL